MNSRLARSKEERQNGSDAAVHHAAPAQRSHGGHAAGHADTEASVADNDLAVGRVAEAISHSPYWDDTAIFILEDDAQNGPDHVDAHRSIALVISKYSPSATRAICRSLLHDGEHDSHHGSAAGSPADEQQRCAGRGDGSAIQRSGNQPPFDADYRNQENGLIYQANPPHGQGAKESTKMDFTHADAVDTAKLNRILWRDRMGKRPEPKPQHTVLPASAKEEDDD